MPLSPDEKAWAEKQIAAGRPKEQVFDFLAQRRGGGQKMPPLVEYGPGGRSYPGGTGYFPGYDQADAARMAFDDPKTLAKQQGLPALGAVLGGVGGRYLGSTIPALQRAGVWPAIARLLFTAGGEGVGAGTGVVAAQKATGQPIDVGEAGKVAGFQTAMSTGLGALGTVFGMGGGVPARDAELRLRGPALDAAGRPDFANVAPGSADDALARSIIRQARETPSGKPSILIPDKTVHPGRLELEHIIQSHDNQGFYIDGEKLLDAMAGAKRGSVNPEAVTANRRLSSDMMRFRQKLAEMSAQNQRAPDKMLGAPAVNIPGETTVIPETRTPAVEPRVIGREAPGVDYLGHPTEGAPIRMQGAPETVIPGETRTTPGVNIPAVPEQQVPPYLRSAYGKANPRAAQNMTYPLTAKQADQFIRENLTRPIREELSTTPGGNEYTNARIHARNLAASQFYKELGPGAATAGEQAAKAMEARAKVLKYFPPDEFGDPMLQTPGRTAAASATANRSASTLVAKLHEFDDIWGTRLVDEVQRLGAKRAWGPADQQTANYISSMLQINRGNPGAWRNMLRLVGRLLVRGQGKTGAAVRATAARSLTPDQQDRQRQAFEDAMRPQEQPK